MEQKMKTDKFVVEGCLRVHASVKLKRKNESRE